MKTETTPCPLCKAYGYNGTLSTSDSEDLVLDHLVLSYASWCEREGLPHLSMDELICEDITKQQRKQLTAYYLLWEELS